jgi:hypothetical protein
MLNIMYVIYVILYGVVIIVKCIFFFFVFEYWGWSPYWVHSALRPIVLVPGDCDDGEVGEMNGFGKGN